MSTTAKMTGELGARSTTASSGLTSSVSNINLAKEAPRRVSLNLLSRRLPRRKTVPRTATTGLNPSMLSSSTRLRGNASSSSSCDPRQRGEQEVHKMHRSKTNVRSESRSRTEQAEHGRASLLLSPANGNGKPRPGRFDADPGDYKITLSSRSKSKNAENGATKATSPTVYPRIEVALPQGSRVFSSERNLTKKHPANLDPKAPTFISTAPNDENGLRNKQAKVDSHISHERRNRALNVSLRHGGDAMNPNSISVPRQHNRPFVVPRTRTGERDTESSPSTLRCNQHPRLSHGKICDRESTKKISSHNSKSRRASTPGRRYYEQPTIPPLYKSRFTILPRAVPPTKLKVKYFHDIKITVIDPVKKIFIADMFSSRDCDKILRSANKYLSTADPQDGWRKLYSYTLMDLPLCDVPALKKLRVYIMDCVVSVISFALLKSHRHKVRLHPRSWREPHLLHYQAGGDKPPHTGVQMHYDGGHLTWQLMLSDLSDYEGGGTYFSCLRTTIKLKKGQILIHPGVLFHKGVDITKGTRDLLICFMDGYDPRVKEDSHWKSSPLCESRTLIV